MLIIGSRALNFWDKNLLNRNPLDHDYVCTIEEYDKFVKSIPKSELKAAYPIQDAKKMIVKTLKNKILDIYEFEIAWPDSTAESLLKLNRGVKVILPPFDEAFMADIPLLFALKASHRYLKDSPHFLKTRRDYFTLMNYLGYGVEGLDPELLAWYKVREKETYTYSHPKLNQDKADFFRKEDAGIYVYDHDTIHKSVARDPEVPAYTKYMKDGAQVACDKSKFFALPEQVRLDGVLEEALVLALERSQIPFKGKVDPKRSFDMALFKVCTSITSGWFREFAYNNFDRVQKAYDPGYVDKFWKDVESGLVRKLEEPKGMVANG
jgi:hypothetical protein